MDHLKLSSHCIVGLQHSGDLAINISHLDVKTFGSLLINDWIAGSTSLTGTTLNVRSGGTIRASNLGLHYTNVSLEPAAFLNVQFDPEAQYQIGKDLGYGVGSTSGSSGAGHGGNGGQGSSQNTVGTSYGNFAMPTDPGSSGGHSVFPHMGGAGAGMLFLETFDTLALDGTIEATGGFSRSPNSGGGSGGSIWIQAEYFDGDGTLDIGGGSGDGGGGGGAGGFAAIYYTYNHYSGDFFTAGGLSSYEPGGSGTVYLHQLQAINGTQLLDATSPEGRIHHESNVTSPLTNRTLYMNSRGRMPRVALQNLTDYYEDVSNVGAMTWLEPSEVAPIVRERNTPSHYYEDHIIIDELHVYGGAEIGFVRPSQPRDELNIRLGTITGDYTARMMVGFNQTLYVSKAHFPLNVDIYRGGQSSLYGELDIKKITFNVEGVLTNVWNMTITQGKESRTGTLNMHEMVDTEGNSTPDFYFHSIVVRNLGTFYTHYGTGTRFIQGNNLQVFGGGLLTSSNLHIDAGEVIVDKKGLITVTGQGYAANEGPGGGITSGGYGSGGTHGGEGGCRSASHESPPAYGSVTHPMEFGSGGGGSGGTGGGMLWLVTDRLEVEGGIESDGGDTSSSTGGGGSGGSIWIETDQRWTRFSVGEEDDLSVFHEENLYHGILDSQGGEGSLYEHGAAGTVYIKQTGEEEHKTIKIYNNFKRAEEQTRRTLVTLPSTFDPDHDIDLLDIGHFAHVELEAVSDAHYPVAELSLRVLNVKRIAGDNTGTMHVGEQDTLNIDPDYSKYLPFRGRGKPTLHTISQDVTIELKGGRVAGVQNLDIHKGAELIIRPDGKINSYNSSHIELESLTVYGAGLVSFTGVTEKVEKLDILVDQFVIKGGGRLEANKLFVDSKNIEIDHDAVIEVSGRGWSRGTGQGAGKAHSNGGSGASHGGLAGQGGGVSYSSPAYGDTLRPESFGSGGSSQSSQKCSGGGVVHLIASQYALLDGEIIADGDDTSVAIAGGGSGGSIWIQANVIAGRGHLSANGGFGGCVPDCDWCDEYRRCRRCRNYKWWQDYNCVDSCDHSSNRKPDGFQYQSVGRYCSRERSSRVYRVGGGGAGGRIALHSNQQYSFRGSQVAYGGIGYLEYGGAGTIYVSDVTTNGTHRELIVSNRNGEPIREFIPTNGLDSGRTVALLGSEAQYHFEKVTIQEKSHLLFKPASEGTNVSIGIIHGDRSGMLHVTAGTPLGIQDSHGPFQTGFRSYSGSDLSLPDVVYLDKLYHNDVFIDSVISGVQDLTIGSNINFIVGEEGKTKGAGQSTFELNNLDILTDGYFQSIYSSDVIHNPPITMVTMPSLSLKLNDSLKMHPGGTIDTNWLEVSAGKEIEIDTAAFIDASGRSPIPAGGMLSGVSSRYGASGGSLGGTGGRGKGQSIPAPPRGSIFTSEEFGSPGGRDDETIPFLLVKVVASLPCQHQLSK
ncbi:hypothetical protein BSL78_29826 [Apostichopus japonicus]|uniref:Tenascin-X n=1 Tax=Stichopus japonicus TaxID=307972 RepID=A0A2G8JC90_STIJA|nr:hypothetical protein BSL78_29826 [Apostichopus japonicus]